MKYIGQKIMILLFFSCEMKLNLDYLLLSLWEHLNLIRVYTKKPGNKKHQTLKSKTNTK
jgi:ribosome-interacting GTPase 1